MIRTLSSLIVLLGLVGGALAQDAPAEAPAANARDERVAKKKKGVIQIEALTVEGVVQKPEAFYILQRSELNFKGLEPRKSFIPLILRSVDKAPF